MSQGGAAGTGVEVQGAAGAGGPSAPGTGGQGGSSAPFGSAGGSSVSGGSAGAPMMGVAGTGPDAGAAACVEQSFRCGSAGREVCTGGDWQAQACPPETPICEG